MRNRFLLSLALATIAACGTQQTTWPKFHHDILQTGASQYTTATNPGTLKWKFTTGGAVRSSPAIADDGTIYVGSGDGSLYALNPNGGGKWAFPTGGAIESSPAVGGDGTVYVGSTDGTLYAVNPNGTSKWKLALGGGPLIGSPALDPGGGGVYIGSNSGNVYAVSSAGALAWKFLVYPGASVVRSPAIGGDGTIYIGAESPDFYALDPSGTAKWNFTRPGNPGTSSAAVGGDGTIYVGSQDNNLYALNPDGTVKWTFSTPFSIIGSSPAIAIDGTVYIGCGDGNLYAVNSTGALKWKFTTGSRIVGSSPAIGFDGTVYVGSGDGSLYAITSAGAQKWKFTTGGVVDSSPAIGSDGTIYVGSDDHNLYAIGAASSPPCPLQANEYTLTQVAGGTVKYGTLSAFATPAGSTLRMDVAAGDASCVHNAVVPYPDGFSMPIFCVPGLNFTIDIRQTACGIGRIDSNGGSDFSVIELADTSSPVVCGLPHSPCATNQSNADVRIDVSVGDGVTDMCTASGKANAVVVVPTRVLVWADSALQCPDVDGMYDAGTDTLITSFPQTLDFTTDSASADYRDLDTDGCCIAGSGPASFTNPCTSGGMGTMTAKGTCIDLTGLDAAGADVTAVAAGAASLGAPLFDITYRMDLPSAMTTSGPFAGAVCPSPPLASFAGSVTRCIDGP